MDRRHNKTVGMMGRPATAHDGLPLRACVSARAERSCVSGRPKQGDGRRRARLAWVTGRGRRIPVVIDSVGPAASLIPALAVAKVRTVIVTTRDITRGCGAFLDDLNAGRLSHAGQALLNATVAGARRRPVGDSGSWAWDRRDGSVFVAPPVAVTLARHGAVTAGRPRSNRAVFV